MGRFTLRDEGKTIALGKVLKYKPVKFTAQPTADGAATTSTDKPKEEAKPLATASEQINTV